MTAIQNRRKSRTKSKIRVEGSLLLDEAQIDQKILRMAYQIYENNSEEKKLYFAGINGAGFKLAEKIKKKVSEISEIETFLIEIRIDKKAPSRNDIEIDGDLRELRNRVIIMVDDVQHTGKTFAYSMRPFLNIEVKKLEVAVLVNRDHTNFPVAPTYTGYELSTTLADHIKVILEDGKKGVFLC